MVGDLIGKAGGVVGFGNPFVGDLAHSGECLNIFQNAQFRTVDGYDQGSVFVEISSRQGDCAFSIDEPREIACLQS